MIQLIEKTPRWFLVLLTAVAIFMGWGAIGLLVKTAFADMDKVKETADRADRLATVSSQEIMALKTSIEKMSNSQETSRKEYREDQIMLNQKLDRILTKV